MNDAAKVEYTKQYLRWLSRYSPKVYDAVMQQLPAPPGDGLGQFEIDPWNMYPASVSTPTSTAPAAQKAWWETALDAVSKAATTYLQYDAQKDILDVQKSRIQQGLPPIQTDLLAPTVRVQADIPPEYRATISSGIQKALLWGALGLGAFFVFRSL